MTDGAVCLEKVRLHGLDLSTKHVVDDSREPENKKGHRMVTFSVTEYGYSDFNFSYDSFIF